MINHTYIDQRGLTKLSDENVYNEYLRQRTFTKNKKGNGISNEMKDLIGNMVNKLNNENKAQKLRCILPQWINRNETAFEKGWLSPNGFIDI